MENLTAAGARPGRAAAGLLQPDVRRLWHRLQYAGEAAAGTGMVINADGQVLTNNHVINGSTKIIATG